MLRKKMDEVFRDVKETFADFKIADIQQILFDDEDKKELEKLSPEWIVNDSSIEMTTSRKQSMSLPSSYVLFALLIRNFVCSLRRYMDLLEKYCGSELKKTVAKHFSEKSLRPGVASENELEDFVFLEFSKLLADSYEKDDDVYGKKIYSKKVDEVIGFRPFKDCFGSLLLSHLPLNASGNSAFSEFCWHLSQQENIYDYLEKKYRDKITCPIIKLQNVRGFARAVMSFLFQYDGWNKLPVSLSARNDVFKIPVKLSGGSRNCNSMLYGVKNCLLNEAASRVKNALQVRNQNIFNEPICEKDGIYVFLSTQWNTGERYTLELAKLCNWINSAYDEFHLGEENGSWVMKYKNNTASSINTSSYIPQAHYQKIYYGAPGTGKSYKIDNELFEDDSKHGLKNSHFAEDQVWRTTFHPDFDYTHFVGCYKPQKSEGLKIEESKLESVFSGEILEKIKRKLQSDSITYEFSPQVFANAYVSAWNYYLNADDKKKAPPVFLVIEEINRGNCAQIFGDIFQLLDRNEKCCSSYEIEPESEFKQWLSGLKIKGLTKKLKLPPNFNILATMNTSDQSLFPMDSAFKRRFDWEYVPINYDEYKKEADGKEDENSLTEWNFEIEVGDEKIEWLRFLKRVNANIYHVTQSEDKQMGEFFIKPKDGSKVIGWKDFRSKVLFYLWDSVYKDMAEDDDAKVVFHYKSSVKKYENQRVTFQSFFNSNEKIVQDLILEVCKNLNAKEYDDFDLGKKIFEK